MKKTPAEALCEHEHGPFRWDKLTDGAKNSYAKKAAAVLAHARQDKRTMLAYTEFHVICKCPKCETERQGREQRARELAGLIAESEARHGARIRYESRSEWLYKKIMEAWND